MLFEISWVGAGSKCAVISGARKMTLSAGLGVVKIDNEVVFKDKV
jgi:hypothetical protein